LRSPPPPETRFDRAWLDNRELDVEPYDFLGDRLVQQWRSNQSPAAVSQKRKFFKCPPETTGYFGRKMPQTGAWRLSRKSPPLAALFCG
jgi:hypothetical protein